MSTVPEQTVRFFDWLTLAALIIAPIASAIGAVVVTRFTDARTARKKRRLDVFKVLMRTRSTRLNSDHVGALNLIEIEFYKEQKVLDALERYFQHLNNRNSAADGWLQTSEHLFTKLLSEMARSLGYQIEQLQILTGGYAPQGWIESENRQTEIQRKTLALLEGKISLPITAGSNTSPAAPAVFTPPPGFPPPPA